MQNFTLTFHVFTYNINSTCKKFSFRFFDNFLQDFLHQEGKNL